MQLEEFVKRGRKAQAAVDRLTAPPMSDVEAERRGIKVDRDGLTRCRVCGCTDREPCCPPCCWQPGEADLCSGCAETAVTLEHWMTDAHRPQMAKPLREVKRLHAAGGFYKVLTGARR